MQHGLAQWLAFLSEKNLPILNRTKLEVQSLINQAQLSITQYATPMLFDAGFSARLFRHVNRQRDTAGKNPLTTLDNALSHLGQGAFQTFLNNTPLLEGQKLSDKNQKGYMRTMANACHAALQAKNWAQQRNVMQPEETQQAALLQNIPELMLWCYADDAMAQIEFLHYVKKKPYESAAKEVLGCGMRELGTAIAEKWYLPEMAQDGLRSRQDDYTLATGVSLAAELSRVVSQNWYGQQAHNIIQRIAKYKAKPEGEIEHRLHLNAVEFTELFLQNEYAPPAKLLPLLADDAYIDQQFIIEKAAEKQTPAVKEKVAAVKKKAQLSPDRDRPASEKPTPGQPTVDKKLVVKQAVNKVVKQAVNKQVPAKQLTETQKAARGVLSPAAEKIKKKVRPETGGAQQAVTETSKKTALNPKLGAAIKEFQLMVAQAKPAHDLIEFAVKTILLCGVDRCVFLVKVPNKAMLISRYTNQVTPDIEMKALKIPLDSPHVFSLLMEKNRNLFLNNTNYAKYWNHIPGTVKLVLGVKQFFAMSIFANAHAMGLMYADKLDNNLTEEEFAQFQGVCRLLSKGIVQAAQNKKKKEKL